MTAFTLDTTQYNQQLAHKLAQLHADFAQFSLPDIQVFESPHEHYRMRAEFRAWHKGNTLELVMFGGDQGRTPLAVHDFPIGSIRINQLIPLLINALNQEPLLKHKLYQVDFLTSLYGEALVTLIYHKPLDEAWQVAADNLRNTLDIQLVGRSRKQKIVLGRDYVMERFNVAGQHFDYQQVEGSFTQPNAAVCEKMLNWAVEKTCGWPGDLVELYCGNGNFTLPLSRNFRNVLATEVSSTSVDSAHFNIAHNKITNIAIARLAAEEFAQALDKVRPFFRLRHIDLESYDFRNIFVDPPRAGLDDLTLGICKRFERIIYISCNPQTLRANLASLTKTHQVTDFALFDQFPYTHHMECGVVLKKIGVRE